ncbi:aspartate kinase [Treponema sp.]
MRKTVVKFGGSNLKTAADVRRSAAVALAYKKPLIIVVSAFSGITDTLVRLVDEAVLSLDAAESALEKLRHFHTGVLTEHVKDFEIRSQAEAKITERLEDLDRILKGIHYLGAVPDFARDAALAAGERLSAPIVTAVLSAAGLDVEERVPESIGLLTDGRFGNASADVSSCTASIASSLAENKSFVIPGFYGSSKEGKITIFGRGGSDYTAAFIARCIQAESLDLWKDVDGFLSCDPRIVSSSRTIPSLTFEEAAELSYFGAKVLHPRTVEPLEGSDIIIRVMNVEKFDGSIHPYTLVVPPSQNQAGDEKQKDASIKSVASSEDAAIIRLEGPGVGSRPGILARTTSRLDAAGVNISSVITAQTCINLLFKKADLERALAVLRAESVAGVLAVEAIDDLAIIAAVGTGIRNRIGAAATVFSALSNAGVNIVLSQAGASPVAIYALVRKEDRKKSLRAVHEAIVGNDGVH